MKAKKNRALHLGLGLGSLLAVVLLLALALATSSDSEVSAKDKPNAKQLAKSLKIVSVDSPTTFQGVNRYLTRAVPGQQLLAVTVDFDRDFKHHLRSSEAGEVYLTTSNATRYHTVDTALPKTDGPGKKPDRQVTFVFSVPQDTTTTTFHYGPDYAVTLGSKNKK